MPVCERRKSRAYTKIQNVEISTVHRKCKPNETTPTTYNKDYGLNFLGSVIPIQNVPKNSYTVAFLSKPFSTKSRVLSKLKKRAFENIVKKGKTC